MPIARQNFSHLDSDSDPSRKDSGAFDSATNIALEPGYVKPQAGNVAVAYDLPTAGVSTRLGGFEDGATGNVVSLLHNSEGHHRLIRFDPVAGTETTLLEWSGLNLSATLLPQGGILDGLLVFLDAAGALRSVNLAKAAAGFYATSLLAGDPYALHLVKQPPVAVPLAVRDTNPDTTDTRAFPNRIGDHAWQFAYQYEYPDGETTPPGPYSALLAIPIAGSDGVAHNVIHVPYPTGTLAASPLVKAVRLLVRVDNETVWQVAGKMSATTDFAFYGTTTGQSLTASESAKLAEAVPVTAGTATIAHSRVMIGDSTEGYTPSNPVLTAAVSSTSGGGATTSQTVYQVDVNYTFDDTTPEGTPAQSTATRTRYWKLESGAYPDPASTYRKLAHDTLSNTYYVVDATAIDTYATAFVTYFGEEVDGSRVITVLTGDVRTAPGAPPPEADKTLHDRCEYSVGVAFFDAQGRTAGAESVVPLLVPKQDYATPVARYVAWALTGVTPPAWAETYHLLLSRNRTTTFFLQYRADGVKRWQGDNSTGTPILVDAVPVAGITKQVWVPLAALLPQGRGYVFEQGDRVRFVEAAGPVTSTDGNGVVFATTYPDQPILEQREGYLALPATTIALFGVGLLTNTPLVEIYRPAALVDNPFLYERGPRYPILNPHTSGAALSVTSGALAGDCAFQPFPDVAEAIAPSAIHFETWLDAGRGRPIPIVTDGVQVRRKNLIRFSGVKVQGTLLNGLGQWEALSQYEDVPQEQGAITRLSVADQTQTDGSILLVNQERGDVSLSLGRSQIQAADGEPLLAISKQVIGGSNALRGGYGCTDPASVVPFAGKVFFFCRRRLEVLRYDRNGLTPLATTYKARTRLAEVAGRYAAARVSAAFHPHLDRRELWLTFHPVGDLPGTTLIYSDLHEAWADSVSAVPEAGLAAGAELLTWQSGNLWRHTTDAPLCSFYGVSYTATLAFTVAQPGGVAKQFKDIAIESASLWTATQLVTDTGLTSRTLGAWFTQREGVYRAGLRRADNSLGFATLYHSLDNGKPLIGTRLSVTLTAPADAQPLTACSVSWIPRTGQQMAV